MKQTINTIFVMLALLAGTAEAAICTSLSAGNWNTAGRWSCGHVPNTADSVVIAHNITMNTNPDIVDFTINAGATLDDNGNDLTVTGSVLINGTYDGSGNNGNLIMQGNGQTLSGTGTIIDIGRIQIDANTTIPAGSNLNLTLNSEIRVGDQNNATLTIDGIITGTGQSSGNRIIRLDSNNTSNVILNGTINAPNSYIEIQDGGTFTNNGTVTLQYLDGNGDATSTWTQGANSSLTLSQPTQSWSGTFNASAVGNTVTWNAPATALTPSGNTYYNLAGSGVTCPHTFSVLGSDPCVSLPGTATYYHATTNGVNIGFDGATNVTSNTNQTIPPIITALLTTANTCTGNARSSNHPTGLYTHSRWYLNTNYAQATQIGANPSGRAYVRGQATTNSIIVNLYDYDPITGGKVLIGSSPAISISGTLTAYPYSIGSAAYVVPAGHRLLLEYQFNQSGATNRARVYCSAANAYITVVETPVIAPVAEYRFDESVAGAAADSSGNGLNGSLNGVVSVGGAGKVCSSYNFNGTNAFVSVPDNALLNRPNVSLSAWVRHSAAATKLWEAILAKGDTTYRLHLNGGCSINTPNTLDGLSFGINGGCNTADIDSGTVPVASQWYHLVGTYDGSTISIYVDGALSASAVYAGAIGNNASPLYIGENAQQPGRYWSGDIDEVKIFGTTLTATQVATIYANENAGNNWDGSARVCPAAGLDHLEIQHATGSGLTCAASTLTIMACADNANPCTPYTAGVIGTLSATGAGMTVNWDGGADFAIPSGSSSVTKNVQVATAGNVTFGVSTATPVPTNGTSCNFGSPACTFTANLAGFLFSNTTTGSAYAIPAQVSGTATGTLYLRAVQASTTNPAVCTPAIIGQTMAVTMGYACNNPNSCQAGNLATINNTTAIAPGGTSVDLNFDGDGSAPVTVRYDDTGQITLSANKTVTPFGGATAVTLVGNSNAFVVAPHHFGISGVTAGPINAGNNFSATVSAYNNLAMPTATPNFGHETTPESVAMSFTKCQPTGTSAVNGSFSGSVGAFANGVATAANLNWSEVGNGDLVATLASGSYLGSGLSATGNTGTGGTVCNGAGNVGRFIPDHFDTIVTGPMICPVGLTCPPGGLVYSGLSFTTNVYARNAAGLITQNYDGTANTAPNFARTVTLEAWDGVGSTTTQNPPVATPGSISNGTIAAGAFSQGATVSPGTPGAPVYTFGTTPTDPTDIYIRATDTDGVTSLRAIPANSVEGGVTVANGHIKVSNAYGSERLPLTLQAVAQYYTANGWMNSITDSVTDLIVNASYVVGTGTSNTTLTPASSTLNNGVLSIRLSEPNVAGTATVLPGITGCIAPCAYMPVAAGTATFGVYSNRNNYIYRREN